MSTLHHYSRSKLAYLVGLGVVILIVMVYTYEKDTLLSMYSGTITSTDRQEHQPKPLPRGELDKKEHYQTVTGSATHQTHNGGSEEDATMQTGVRPTQSKTSVTHKSEWVQRRQVLLKSTINRKVILKTYMRGGSTLFGELFNQNPDATYWYEPVSFWYSATYGLQEWPNHIDIMLTPDGKIRNKSLDETHRVQQCLEAILNCDVKKLPDEVFTRSSFVKSKHIGGQCRTSHSAKCSEPLSKFCGRKAGDIGTTMYSALKSSCYKYLEITLPNRTVPQEIVKYRSCMSKFHADAQNCRKEFLRVCEKSTIQVPKVIRVSLSTLEELIKANPDVNILFYVRDPRGIINSRKDLQNARPMKSSLGLGNSLAEAKYLCTVMKHDYEWWKILSERYPGSIHMLRYEDLAKDPLTKAEEVYAYLNRTLPEPVSNWIKENVSTGDVKKKYEAFSTSRTNSTATSMRWKKSWTKAELTEFNNVCGEVLNAFNYEI